MTRLERLQELATSFWLEPADVLAEGARGHFTSTATEDLHPYLAGAEEVGRFCVVTRHEDFYYLYPRFEEWGPAADRASEHVNDDIFTEFPIAVVDLDTGERWDPRARFEWTTSCQREAA